MKNLKKTFCLITCLAVLISAFSLFAVSSSAQEAVCVWDGTVADSFAGGSGTVSDPYLISTPSQLAYFASDSNEKYSTAGIYYKLTDDIYMNIVIKNDFERKNAWVNNQVWFNGNFNGDGHIIYGLYVSESAAAEYAGFIPKINIGCVRNLGISHSDITAKGDCGSVAGYVQVHNEWTWDENEVILTEQCFSDKTVSIKGNCAGGIIGRAYNGNNWNCNWGRRFFVRNCYSAAEVKGGKASAIVGYIFANRFGVQNCYTVTDKNILQYQWLNPGNENYTYYHSNNYAVSAQSSISAAITLENIIGEAAKANMPGFDFDNIWRTVEGGYPELRIFPEKTPEPVKGDVDGDGKLGSEDLIILRKILLSAFGSETPESADVNGNGEVDILDLIILKKMLVQM